MKKHTSVSGWAVAGICALALMLPAGVWAQEEDDRQETDLGEIHVSTSTKSDRAIDEVPLTVEVVTKEELEQANVKTVAEAVNYLAGIQTVQNSGSWGNKGNIQLQGMDSSHTLILLDGQRYYGGHDSVDLQSISVEMIERIEIVKGPISSLYGSDAMGGVVNIITNKWEGKPYGHFSAEGGSRDTQMVEASAAFGQDRWGGLLTFTRRRSDGIDAATDKYQENIISGNLSYTFNPQSKLEIRPYYSLNQIDYEGRDQKRSGLNVNWKYDADELSHWYVRSSIFDYQHQTKSRSTNYDTDSLETEIGYRRLLGSQHQLTVGTQFHREDIDDPGKGYEADQTINALFIQDEMDLAPVQIVLGTRVDDHQRWGTQVNPNLSLGYQLNEQTRLRASVGKAFKAPGLVNLYAEGWRMGPYTVHANPGLEPEESVGYQAGLDYRFSERLSGQATLFRNDIKNLITAQIVSRNMYWQNVGKAMTQGVELSLRAQMSATLNGSLGYTLLDTEDKESGKELLQRPHDSINLGLNWQALPGLDFHLSGRYVGERYNDDDNTEKLKDYFLLNLGLEKKLNEHYALFVNANNLLGVDDAADAYDLDGVEYYVGVKLRF